MNSKLPYAKCYECPLAGYGPAVPGYGPEDADIIFVGEAPGQQEVLDGIPFVGQSGKLLHAMLDEIKFEGTLYKTNIVACRPPGNRTPTQHEVACCVPRLRNELNQQKSKKIVSLGKTAHDFFNVPFQPGILKGWNDFTVMPTWHPAYVLRDPSQADVFKKTMERAAYGPWDLEFIPKPALVWPKTPEELESVLEYCKDDAWVAFDIESANVQWYDTKERPADVILMLQIAWTEEWAVIVGDDLLYDYRDEVTPILQKFFNRVRTCAHNGKFDTVFQEHHLDLHIRLDFDTLLAHYIINENIAHGLKGLASLYLGMIDYEKDTIQPYLKTRNDDYSKVPSYTLAVYGAWDVVVTLRLRDIFEKELRQNGQYDLPFLYPIMSACRQFHYAELRGMAVDVEQLDWMNEQFGNEVDELIRNMREVTEEPNLNPRSPQQLAALFYDKWNFPLAKVRKAGPRSTNKEVLQKLEGKHPVIEMLTEFRRIDKMWGTYVKNINKYLSPEGRVHADFRIPGTEVGRISVADPPLQTIPRPDDYYGAMIRSAFIGAHGMVLIVCDYSQAELRVFACEANEPFLLKVYAEGRDLHSEVAVGMFGEGFTKAQRVQCKMFNFSYLYGGNEYSFAKDAGLNIAVAKQFVHDYNRLMPVGLEYKREQFKKLKRDGYVETIFHRRRHFPLLTDANREEARKACVHMPIASTANDLTLMSGIAIQKQMPEFNVKRLHEIPGVVLEVHDSVIAEVPENEAEDVAKMMHETMERVASEVYPQLPWKADADIGKRWAEPLPHP